MSKRKRREWQDGINTCFTTSLWLVLKNQKPQIKMEALAQKFYGVCYTQTDSMQHLRGYLKRRGYFLHKVGKGGGLRGRGRQLRYLYCTEDPATNRRHAVAAEGTKIIYDAMHPSLKDKCVRRKAQKYHREYWARAVERERVYCYRVTSCCNKRSRDTAGIRPSKPKRRRK